MAFFKRSASQDLLRLNSVGMLILESILRWLCAIQVRQFKFRFAKYANAILFEYTTHKLQDRLFIDVIKLVLCKTNKFPLSPHCSRSCFVVMVKFNPKIRR